MAIPPHPKSCKYKASVSHPLPCNRFFQITSSHLLREIHGLCCGGRSRQATWLRVFDKRIVASSRLSAARTTPLRDWASAEEGIRWGDTRTFDPLKCYDWSHLHFPSFDSLVKLAGPWCDEPVFDMESWGWFEEQARSSKNPTDG